MQVEDQIDDHGSVHSLLDVAGQCDFVDAKLIWHAFELIFEAKLRRLVFDS